MALLENIDKIECGEVVEWERLDFKRGRNPDDVSIWYVYLLLCGMSPEILDDIQKE